MLTDPIWYAGRKVPGEVLGTIRAWQLGTGSLVFVDGTFQYMQLHYVQGSYHRLLDTGAVDGHVDLETGYFLFARPLAQASRTSFLSMGQDFFELSGYPDHVRINLLNNSAIDAL